MHIDLAHAGIAAVLVLLTFVILKRMGAVKSEDKKRWNWTLFWAVFVVMAVFNFVWSAANIDEILGLSSM